MKTSPDLSPRKQVERAERGERLARALRDNLRRRKEQARAQAERGRACGDAATSLSGRPFSSKSDGHGGTTAD